MIENSAIRQIFDYIEKTCKPLSVIVYGSYSDGSYNENSDFDAIVISEAEDERHDTSIVDGIRLDVFVYPEKRFQDRLDPSEFFRISGGYIHIDRSGDGARLMNAVSDYENSLPKKSDKEIQDELEWCKKMLLRTKRNDPEGMFRWHWLLTDSLEIFCDKMHCRYRGPKKSLIFMKSEYPDAYSLYTNALRTFDLSALEMWIGFLCKAE